MIYFTVTTGPAPVEKKIGHVKKWANAKIVMFCGKSCLFWCAISFWRKYSTFCAGKTKANIFVCRGKKMKNHLMFADVEMGDDPIAGGTSWIWKGSINPKGKLCVWESFVLYFLRKSFLISFLPVLKQICWYL